MIMDFWSITDLYIGLRMYTHTHAHYSDADQVLEHFAGSALM